MKEFEKKEPFRMLIQQGHIKDNMEMYATMGKRKTETGYLLCVIEKFNGTNYGDSKMYDSYTWLFSTDEQGNVLDKIKIGEMNGSLKDDSPISVLASYYLEKISKLSEKEVTFSVIQGKTAKGSNLFKGEKIIYMLKGGKFKETGRKKEVHSTEGGE